MPKREPLTSSVNDLFNATQFGGDELRNSYPLDLGRWLSEDAAAALLPIILGLAARNEQRARALQPAAKIARERTASVLLANLISAALNWIDDSKFIAVSFDNNTYAGTPMSAVAMSLLRDALLSNGLIEGRGGGRKVEPNDVAFGWLTRIRATAALRAVFADCGITDRSVQRAASSDVIVIRDRSLGVEVAPPAWVEWSRPIVEEVNRRIVAASVDLPSETWAVVKAAWSGRSDLEDEDRTPAGDLTAKSLARLYNGTWSRGGRLYGGWWMSLPKAIRGLLTIDGEAVVELDYGQLHPSILYARLGEELEDDAYTIGPWDSPPMRNLGKTTFARMLNTTSEDGQSRSLKIKTEDIAKLTSDLTWEAYLQRFEQKHEAIAQWFWIGEGMKLQCEDSDLACHVLRRLTERDIVALPVHDSFIVARGNKARLEYEMQSAYRERYGFKARVK